MHLPGNRQLSANRRYLLGILLLIIVLYVVVPQLGDFRASWHLLRHPAAVWVITATGLTMLTYFAAAATYCFLALKPLNYGQTVVVELAAMFINRLLPSGIGALGANYAYLRRMKHSAAQAATLVTINNLLGIVGHVLVLAVAVAVSPARSLMLPDKRINTPELLRVLAIVALVLAVLLVIVGRQKRLRQRTAKLFERAVSYRSHLWHLAAGLASSIALTLSNVLCLACCGLAFGVHLSFIDILVVFSFGLGAGTATPTPGGLGGFEAGLTAALIVYHVDSPVALAIALLYRLISYWLPLLVGAPALLVAQKRRLFIA